MFTNATHLLLRTKLTPPPLVRCLFVTSPTPNSNCTGYLSGQKRCDKNASREWKCTYIYASLLSRFVFFFLCLFVLPGLRNVFCGVDGGLHTLWLNYRYLEFGFLDDVSPRLAVFSK